jgi:hypothetical protein
MDQKGLDAYGAVLADGCVSQMNNQPPSQARRPCWEASPPIGGATLRTDRDGAGLVVSVRLCTDTGPLFALGG